MAERYAIGTGSWSDPTKWDGGVALPTAGDDVHANNFTITIDQDVTVASLRTTAGTTAVQGGGFTLSTVHNITANILAGSSACLSITATTGTATITGTVNGSAASGQAGINISGAGCTVNVIGAVTGGGTTNAYGISILVASTLNITGNVTAGSAANCRGVNMPSGASVVTITGNVTGGGNFSAVGVHVAAGTLTVVGDITAATGNGVASSVNTNAVIHDGDLICSSTGVHAVFVFKYLVHATNAALHKYRVNNAGSPGDERTLGAPLPAVGDVRSGTAVGDGTGTLQVGSTGSRPMASALSSSVAS